MSFWGHLIVSFIHSLWLSVITWTRHTGCVMVFKSSYAAWLLSIFSLLFIARSLVLPVYLNVGVSVCANHTLCFRGGSYSGFPPSESTHLELTNSPVGYYPSLLLKRKEDLQLMPDHFWDRVSDGASLPACCFIFALWLCLTFCSPLWVTKREIPERGLFCACVCGSPG